MIKPITLPLPFNLLAQSACPFVSRAVQKHLKVNSSLVRRILTSSSTRSALPSLSSTHEYSASVSSGRRAGKTFSIRRPVLSLLWYFFSETFHAGSAISAEKLGGSLADTLHGMSDREYLLAFNSVLPCTILCYYYC